MVESVQGVDREEHVVVLVAYNDPRLLDYAATFAVLPRAWDVWLTDNFSCGRALNHAFDRFPDEPFYGFLADDITLDTPGMLGELREEALNGYFAWPNDGVHGPRMSTHPAAPGKMLRAMGFWAHPLFPHNGLDTVMYRVSESLGLSRFREDLILTHHHPFAAHRPDEWDETYDDAREDNSKAIDLMARFEQEGLPQLLRQVRSVYEQKVCA